MSMIEAIFRKNPRLGLKVRPMADALQVDPEVFAAMLMGMNIVEEIDATIANVDQVMAGASDGDPGADEHARAGMLPSEDDDFDVPGPVIADPVTS